MKHIAMFSGGQDSTAMIIKLLEDKKPLDYIVFSDTNLEFPQMYDYVDKIDAYIKRKFNISITRISNNNRFDEFCFGKYKSGEFEGKIRGLPKVIGMHYCTRELKIVPFEKWIKVNNIGEHYLYIGYTYSELKRAKDKPKNQIFPLIEAKIKEIDVSIFLKERNIWNTLYRHFTRTGCYLCPKQKKEAFYMLYKHYKEQWEKMKWYENECKKLNAHNQTFNIDITLLELEKEFKRLDRQGSLFEFEEDPMLSCFCGT